MTTTERAQADAAKAESESGAGEDGSPVDEAADVAIADAAALSGAPTGTITAVTGSHDDRR
jgi:hypothetical protein